MGALLKLAEIESGEILLEGASVKSLGAAVVRRRVSVLPQDPVVFIGTLRYNVDPLESASDEKVKEVLERSSLGRWTGKLDEEVSGIASGGEKQLICLARAFLRSSPLVFLDEAMSAIDADTEAVVSQA